MPQLRNDINAIRCSTCNQPKPYHLTTCTAKVGEIQYVELNMDYYSEDQVSQLNDWAIEAVKVLDSITGEAGFGGLPESKQESILALLGQT